MVSGDLREICQNISDHYVCQRRTEEEKYLNKAFRDLLLGPGALSVSVTSIWNHT